ncbi:MAG: hypothetical protein Q9167_006121 [Letrouitia subvulpina]
MWNSIALDSTRVALGLQPVWNAGSDTSSDSGATTRSDESQSTKDERSEAEFEVETKSENKFLGNEFEIKKKVEKEEENDDKWDFAVPNENGEGWTKGNYQIGMKGFLRNKAIFPTTGLKISVKHTASKKELVGLYRRPTGTMTDPNKDPPSEFSVEGLQQVLQATDDLKRRSKGLWSRPWSELEKDLENQAEAGLLNPQVQKFMQDWDDSERAKKGMAPRSWSEIMEDLEFNEQFDLEMVQGMAKRCEDQAREASEETKGKSKEEIEAEIFAGAPEGWVRIKCAMKGDQPPRWPEWIMDAFHAGDWAPFVTLLLMEDTYAQVKKERQDVIDYLTKDKEQG